ncbi:MAG TPA: C45 family peptidase [Chloroflexota bacterium]|nr:C45 family peptidase [Chloroflexota bacterium]
MVVNEDLRVIHLTGTSRERGRAYGEQLRDAITFGIGRWKEALQASTGIRPNEWLEEFVESTNFLPAIERWAPHLLEEVRGIAEGADIPFRDAYAYQLMDEEWAFRYQAAKSKGAASAHCSVIGARESANTVILAQNMDLPAYYDGTQTLLQFDDLGNTPASLVFTPAGIIGTCGVNTAGVGVCVNTLAQLPRAPEGLPVAFVMRRLLEYRTLGDAVAFLQTVPHASGQNYAIGGPDGVVDFECSASSVTQFGAGRNCIVHTNHPLAAAGEGRDEERDMTNSEMRYAFLENAVDGKQITVELAESLLSSRETPISLGRDEGTDSMTLGSLVMELSVPPILHLAPGPPNETPYRRWTF